MLALYVVFDGFDLGAGVVHLVAARTDEERRVILRSIGPVWDGNEVWLLAAGGTLYFAFPTLYAASFSGFYLPLMMVLWLLILRATAIEFRSHIRSPLWAPFWDGAFSLASLLLAIFYGAALGNVVRGVPLDENGRFFEPLWTSFLPHGATGILDWYTVLVGLTALAALTLHGALWIALKSADPLGDRARRLARAAWWLTVALTVVVTAATLGLQPLVLENLSVRPWGRAFPALALAGLGVARWFLARRRDLPAFLGSCAYLLGMMASAAFGVYPYVLPSSTARHLGLTVDAAAAPPYGLRIGLIWWGIGMALALVYFVFVYRKFAGRVRLEEDEGY
jgi:cytochrome d ubiquinol oxidase subunit II